MSLTPHGEEIRRAVKWIGQHRQDDPDADVYTLVEQAAVKFNLSPKETDFLYRFVTEDNDDDDDY